MSAYGPSRISGEVRVEPQSVEWQTLPATGCSVRQPGGNAPEEAVARGAR